MSFPNLLALLAPSGLVPFPCNLLAFFHLLLNLGEGLFPNTPEVGKNGWEPNPNVCSSDLKYPSNMLCTLPGIASVSYSEFAGIMAGMLTFGFLADRIGRKGAGILTSCFMVIGLIGMVFYTNSIYSRLFQIWSLFFALFGFG